MVEELNIALYRIHSWTGLSDILDVLIYLICFLIWKDGYCNCNITINNNLQKEVAM